jgi:DNA polymerase-1
MPEQGEPNRVYIIDSTLMLYRYFRGIPPMSAEGKRTEAVYGFGKMLMSLMSKQPDGVIAVFDHGQHNFRNYLLPTYKEHYVAMPEELKTQVALAKEMCAVLDVDVYSVNEVEADDVIATLARKATKAGKEVVVVSTDRDFFQMIDSSTKVLVPAAENHGLNEAPVLYDEAAARTWLEQKYGVGFNPKLISDFKAIVGSTAKDIPGVKGIGEKGAAKLVQQYGSVEKIVSAMPTMPSGQGGTRKLLEASLINLWKSKELTKISADVRLKQFKAEKLTKLGTYSADIAGAFFEGLGMKDLARRSRRLAGSMLMEQAATYDEQAHAEGLVGRPSKPEPLFV